jgi:hypothetical protein
MSNDKMLNKKMLNDKMSNDIVIRSIRFMSQTEVNPAVSQPTSKIFLKGFCTTRYSFETSFEVEVRRRAKHYAARAPQHNDDPVVTVLKIPLSQMSFLPLHI